MKRSAILVIVVLVLTLALGLASEWGSDYVARRYQSALMRVGVALSEGQWEQARDMMLVIADRWEVETDLVQLWVNHTDSDAVTNAIRDLTCAITLQDELWSTIYYGQCLENFGHLHHRDAFTLKNIL